MVRRILASSAAALALVSVAAPSAHGAAHERVTIGVNRTVTQSYPAILGVNPTADQQNQDLQQPPDPDPATCASFPACDVIPITVTQPKGLSVFDTFSLRVELRWDGAGPSPSDLDLYLWYDPQGAIPAKESSGDAKPETVEFPAPTSVQYQVVVNNSAGANQGYTLTFISRYVQGERPDLGGSSASSLPPLSAAPPFETNAGGSTPTSLEAAVPGASPVGEVDADLGALSATGVAPRIFREGDTATRPHEPVSGLTVAVWAGLVPLALSAIVGTVLYRRRPRALRS